MKRDQSFRVLARYLPDDIVVSTYTSAFEWIAIRPHPLNYLAVGAMGLASSHALGLALAFPERRIVVLDGDGSLLMNLGSLVTIAGAAPRRLLHFVSVNGTYEANGDHPLPNAGSVDFEGLARSAGYRQAATCSDLDALERGLPGWLQQDGPTFVALKLTAGDVAPRLDYAYMHGQEVRDAFMAAVRLPSDARSS